MNRLIHAGRRPGRHRNPTTRFTIKPAFRSAGRLRRPARVGIALLVLIAALVLALAEPAWAAASLKQVIDNLRNWLVGLLATIATLFLTVGGVRMLLAGGDPGEVGKAKNTLKFAALGYAIAFLAPLLFAALKKIVGA